MTTPSNTTLSVGFVFFHIDALLSDSYKEDKLDIM